MTILEEIKAKIRAGEINEAMSMAISEALKLEIVTSLSEIERQPSTNYLRTFINLLENEMEYQVSEQLISNSAYNYVKQVHLEQVEQGNERILKNVESLQKMFSMLSHNLSELP